MNMKKNLEQKLYDLALKKTEYTQIIEKIGRVPNDLG